MYEIPCLVFSDEAKLCDQYRVMNALPRFTDLGSLETAFITSLRRGDRIKFAEFCELSPDDASKMGMPSYRFFSLIGFPTFKIAFCEKNIIRDMPITSVFLAANMEHLYPIMSPSSVHYKDVTSQIVSELMMLSGGNAADRTYISPEMLVSMRHMPTVIQSLLSHNCGAGLCDIRRITEMLVTRLKEIPTFKNTEITYSSNLNSGKQLIIELYSEIYVHILTSVITIMASLSKNHIISTEVFSVCTFR